MPVIPASPRKSAYIDHANAVSTPRLTSVSIVAAPWRRFTQAARWNGHAPQITTGVAMDRPRAPDHDGRRELQREPLPVVELQRRDHRQQQHDERERRGDEQP